MALAAAVSLLFLLLPLEGESSSWPGWLHVTINMKLIAAFALGKPMIGKHVVEYTTAPEVIADNRRLSFPSGMVTMAILRS